MIKKHRILWAEALFVGVVYILHPRLFGWIDSDVLFLILAFLVLLAMHEESQNDHTNRIMINDDSWSGISSSQVGSRLDI